MTHLPRHREGRPLAAPVPAPPTRRYLGSRAGSQGPTTRPGVFALWQETRYERTDDSFTLIAFDRVESVDIHIPFVAAD